MYVQVRHDRDLLKSLRIGDVLGDGSSRYLFFYSLFILEEFSKIVGHVLYAPLISSKPEIVTVNILFLIYVYMDGFGICLWKHVKWEVIAKPCRKGDGPRRGDVQAVVH